MKKNPTMHIGKIGVSFLHCNSLKHDHQHTYRVGLVWLCLPTYPQWVQIISEIVSSFLFLFTYVCLIWGSDSLAALHTNMETCAVIQLQLQKGVGPILWQGTDRQTQMYVLIENELLTWTQQALLLCVVPVDDAAVKGTPPFTFHKSSAPPQPN